MSGKPKLWWHIAFRQQLVFLGMLLKTGEPTTAWIKQVIPEASVLVYQYWDANGEGREQAPRGIQGAMSVGDQFLVLVDPANPKRHEIDMLGVRASC